MRTPPVCLSSLRCGRYWENLCRHCRDRDDPLGSRSSGCGGGSGDFRGIAPARRIASIPGRPFWSRQILVPDGHSRNAHDRRAHEIGHIVEIVGCFLQEKSLGNIEVAVFRFPVHRAVGYVVDRGYVHRRANGVFADIIARKFTQGRNAHRETYDHLAAALAKSALQSGGLAHVDGDGLFQVEGQVVRGGLDSIRGVEVAAGAHS